MSVVIKISYETDTELQAVLSLLDPIIKDFTKANEKKGKYERVYIKTNDIDKKMMGNDGVYWVAGSGQCENRKD